MAKAYSLLSWNIEHFGDWFGDDLQNRIVRIANEIKTLNPDVFAIYEVEGREVFKPMVENFPGYSFHITEGPQVQETLVAVKSNITSFYTQRVEFKSGIHLLRPGSLLTLRIDGKNYPILFLHLKSFDDPRSFGLRDDMVRMAVKFSSVLRENGRPANYLFIGDLNIMGLDYYYDRDILPEVELNKHETYASRYYSMKRLDKTHPYTWSNGSASSYQPSDLDHCFAAKHLQFKMFNNNGAPGKSPVDVRGWVDKSNAAEQDQWIADYSDHSYLYLEVQKV